MASDWDADQLRVCVVGSEGSGKTSLLTRINTGKTPDEELPPKLEEFTVNVTVAGKSYEITLADTLASEDRDRRLAYTDTDCFIICFDSTSADAAEAITTWIKDLNITHQSDTPASYFVVGTHSDLPSTVDANEIKEVKEKYSERITGFFSVSSKTGDGFQEMWTAVQQACVKNHQPPAHSSDKSTKNNNNQGDASAKRRRGCQLF